jgi:arylsulfatase A-like enzyme
LRTPSILVAGVALSPETFPHMAAWWAVAGNTPFMWANQVASNFRGIRNPLVVSWPSRIKAKGEMRSQFQHVVDIARIEKVKVDVSAPTTVAATQQ